MRGINIMCVKLAPASLIIREMLGTHAVLPTSDDMNSQIIVVVSLSDGKERPRLIRVRNCRS